MAARLVEEHGKPAIVIGLDGELGRGSARTPAGLNLYTALKAAGHTLERFGGHAAAAGLTIRPAAIDAFHDAFDAAMQAQVDGGPSPSRLNLDAELPLDTVDLALVEELERLEPCGVGNPEPCIVTRPIVLEHARVVGGAHLQVTFRDGGCLRDGIAFRFASRNPGPGARVAAAYVPEIDTFRGQRRLRLRVRDLLPL